MLTTLASSQSSLDQTSREPPTQRNAWDSHPRHELTSAPILNLRMHSSPAHLSLLRTLASSTIIEWH